MKRGYLLFLYVVGSYGIQAQSDSLWTALESVNSSVDTGEIYEALYDYYYDLENDSALYVAEQHLEYARLFNLPKQEVGALINKGLYFDAFKSEYEKSLEIYHNAYDIANNNNLASIKDVCHFIGVLFHLTSNYEKAKEYYLQSIAFSREYSDEYRYCATSINLASIYSSLAVYDSAKLIFMDLVERENLPEHLRGVVWNNLANLYIRDGQYKKSLPWLTKSLNYHREVKNYGVFIQALDYMIEAKSKLNNLNGLDTLAQSLKSMLTKTNNLRIISLGYQSLAQAYFSLGDFREAYLAKENHMIFYDSMRILSQSEKLFELEARYQNQLKENEINTLKIESQQSEIASNVRKNQRNIFVSLSTLFLLLIIFYIVRYRQKNKSNGLLEEKNRLIESALQEKEILLKEIHHRVKNNLQVISSLLNLQAENLSTESALEAITEGQNRVKTMSLIHQRLYQENDLRGVDVHDYLSTLIPQLIRSFTLDNKGIDYKIDVGDMKLDVDTLVPLGLIINELITNSIKYAFEEMNGGIIELSMKEEDDKLHVSIRDNGKGLDKVSLENSNSFGWKMINSLSRKLKAELNISIDGGTVVDILVGRYKLVI